MATLRSAQGCPWDRKQTHETLRPFLLEETYEALDAIDRGDIDALGGELGDVLFQCVFHAQIAAEAGRFEMADAITHLTGKLIRRHPHVFTPAGRPLTAADRRRRSVRTAGAVLEQWEQIKAREQADAGRQTRVLAGVPQSLPALLRAHEIGARVAAVGFDWPDPAGVMAKIEEEVGELREALSQTPGRAAEEFGDLLFSLANLGRKLGLDAESALRQANDKFTRRFDALEAGFEADGRSVHGAPAADLEAAWTRVKSAASTAQAATTARPSSARQSNRRRSRG